MGHSRRCWICFSLKALSKFLQVVTLQLGAVIFLVITASSCLGLSLKGLFQGHIFLAIPSSLHRALLFQ